MELACTARPTGPYIAWRMLLSAISAIDASASTPKQWQSVILLYIAMQQTTGSMQPAAYLCAMMLHHILQASLLRHSVTSHLLRSISCRCPVRAALYFVLNGRSLCTPSIRVNALVYFRPCSDWSTATHMAFGMHLSQVAGAIPITLRWPHVSYSFKLQHLCKCLSHLTWCCATSVLAFRRL